LEREFVSAQGEMSGMTKQCVMDISEKTEHFLRGFDENISDLLPAEMLNILNLNAIIAERLSLHQTVHRQIFAKALLDYMLTNVLKDVFDEVPAIPNLGVFENASPVVKPDGNSQKQMMQALDTLEKEVLDTAVSLDQVVKHAQARLPDDKSHEGNGDLVALVDATQLQTAVQVKENPRNQANFFIPPTLSEQIEKRFLAFNQHLNRAKFLPIAAFLMSNLGQSMSHLFLVDVDKLEIAYREKLFKLFKAYILGPNAASGNEADCPLTLMVVRAYFKKSNEYYAHAATEENAELAGDSVEFPTIEAATAQLADAHGAVNPIAAILARRTARGTRRLAIGITQQLNWVQARIHKLWQLYEVRVRARAQWLLEQRMKNNPAIVEVEATGNPAAVRHLNSRIGQDERTRDLITEAQLEHLSEEAMGANAATLGGDKVLRKGTFAQILVDGKPLFDTRVAFRGKFTHPDDELLLLQQEKQRIRGWLKAPGSSATTFINAYTSFEAQEVA
ncbi:unnamed protein product, partial [Amoebophrya sp. A120]